MTGKGCSSSQSHLEPELQVFACQSTRCRKCCLKSTQDTYEATGRGNSEQNNLYVRLKLETSGAPPFLRGVEGAKKLEAGQPFLSPKVATSVLSILLSTSGVKRPEPGAGGRRCWGRVSRFALAGGDLSADKAYFCGQGPLTQITC